MGVSRGGSSLDGHHAGQVLAAVGAHVLLEPVLGILHHAHLCSQQQDSRWSTVGSDAASVPRTVPR